VENVAEGFLEHVCFLFTVKHIESGFVTAVSKSGKENPGVSAVLSRELWG
jgi:hypothetical protein